MSDQARNISTRPPNQRAIQDECIRSIKAVAKIPIAGAEQSIPERFESIVGYHGKRIALSAANHDPLTYAGLLEQVKYTVERLNNLGIGRGDRIALVLPDGVQMAAAFLGISSAATCAPLHPAFRAQEYFSLFADLTPKALVVEAGAVNGAIAAAKRALIPIIEMSPAGQTGIGHLSLQGERLESTTQRGFAGSDDVALMLFTSGTTAKPKLVPLSHNNLLASAHNIAATLELTGNDRCLNIMPLFHIHGLIGALLASLVSGGSVICPPGFKAPQFFDWLKEFQPTWYSAVPTMHQAILERAQDHSEVIREYRLRFIRSSSAAMPARVMADLERIFAAPVIESYGMTEAAHQMASNPLPPGRRKAGSVGTAAGPQVAIMDVAGNLQPAGTAGEVVICGANVMHGYENNSDANAAAFTHGWFRTGDQGYLDSDGFLFLTGRIKELINRGGEKISPREIDDVLLAHPAVAQAVAFAVPHATLGEDVAAAVILRPLAKAEAMELREFAATKLADFKVPRQIVIVDEIPKSPTGKLQRSGLAEQFAVQLNVEYLAPQSELERALANIVAEVLGVEHVGATDNFFALGGDSLRATQVIARIRAMLDVNLSIATIFTNSTVVELADEILRVIAETNDD